MIWIFHRNARRMNHPSRSGSATLMALFMLGLLSFIGATVLFNVSRRYSGNERAQGWQEALYAAEMGADIGLANVRWTAVSGSPTAFDTALGWTKTTTANNTVYTYTTPIFNQAGEGTAQTWAVVTVDSPIGDNSTNPPAGLTDQSGNQWYRVRSTGHARLGGFMRVSDDTLSNPNARGKNALRKYSLRVDRTTGTVLSAPEATRTIEQIIKPQGGSGAALIAQTTLTISGGQVIDSYDSSDPTKSTNGLYDPSPGKRQSHGNVFTNGSSSKSLTIASGEKVYGNAATNGGNFTDPNNTIQSPGTINNSTNSNLPDIPVPTWVTGGNPPLNNSVTTVTSAKTITINSDPTQNYYKLADINNTLTVALGSGVTTGTLNIWLTGGATTSGSITIPKGATVKIYFTGDTFHPRNDTGINNLNKDPSTFQFYGAGTGTGSGPGIDFHVGASATAEFYGTVYAPYRLINLKYDAKAPNAYGFYGSFVGNVINAVGPIHYDEAWGGVGAPTDYTRASYVEDPR